MSSFQGQHCLWQLIFWDREKREFVPSTQTVKDL